jgi:DNA polymerase-3 subunit gamma/tau
VAQLSLYRKYRPQTFAEVVGQEHVTTTLARAVDEGRWHHAYLFTGPRGTGKTSTARILAKSLNCERGPTSTPDNTCGQCVSVTEGSSVDVIEIDAASHGGVDDVRDLRERVTFAPAAARTKVYIVDECHMLSTAGWNAFLKTVEEPPGHVVFVFATTEPHKVLSTILSRTQRFDLRRIPAEALLRYAADIAGREGVELEPGALDLVVRAGDGSARDTLSVLDQVIAFSGSHVTLAAVAEVLGAVADELLVETADAIAAGDVARLCGLVQSLADSGVDLRQFARDAVEHLRALFLLQVAPDAGLVETTPERLDRLTAQSGKLGRVELLRAVELLAEAQVNMRRGNTRLPLEIALVKAALPEASGDPAALAARMDRLERRTGLDPVPNPSAAPAAGTAPRPDPDASTASWPGSAAPAAGPDTTQSLRDGEARPAVAPEAEPAPAPPPVPEPVAQRLHLDLIRESWPAVLAAVKSRRKRRLLAFLNVAAPIALEGRVLTLQFAPRDTYAAEQVAIDTWAPPLGEVFTELFGEPLRVRAVLTDDGPSPHPVDELAAQEVDVAETEAAEAAGALPDEAAVHDLAIATLRRDLGATLVEDS